MVTWWLLFFSSRADQGASHELVGVMAEAPVLITALSTPCAFDLTSFDCPYSCPPPAESFQSILPAFIYCITSLTSTSTTTVLTMPAVFSFCRSSAIQELAQRPVSCLSLSGGVNQSVASGLFQEVPALQPNNLRGDEGEKGGERMVCLHIFGSDYREKKAFLFPNWSNVMFPPFHATQLSSSIALIQLIDRVNMLC